MMPPRLQLLKKAVVTLPSHSYQPIAPFLYPFLHQQRSASILSSLSDNPGAYSKRIRRGRGPASGKGKTAGRGHKGQKQHGKVPAGFNGGQTPDWVVAGKRGFTNPFSVDLAPINLNRIQYWINQGRLDPTAPITLKELNASRCIHQTKDGVKLLARGKEELVTPIHLVVSRASAEAIAAVERVGGSVTTRYYTRFAMSKIKQGQMDPMHSLQSRLAVPADEENVTNGTDASVPSTLSLVANSQKYKYRLPDPTSRKDLEYYRDPKHRGYLSHLVKDGDTPSLFFKSPAAIGKRMAAARKSGAASGEGKSENRLW